MSFLGLVFRCTDTYHVTGRGTVALADILKGGPRPAIPYTVHWTDPSGRDRTGEVTGMEQFCNLLGKTFYKDTGVGIIVRGATAEDFEPGTMIYTDPEYPTRESI